MSALQLDMYAAALVLSIIIVYDDELVDIMFVHFAPALPRFPWSQVEREDRAICGRSCCEKCCATGVSTCVNHMISGSPIHSSIPSAPDPF